MFNRHKIRELIAIRQDKNKGETLQDISSGIGISYQTLYDITNKETFPKVNNLELIADFFKVDMNYFFDQYKSDPNKVTSGYPAEKENPWKICYEQQKEITELKIELESFRKFQCATEKDAKAG